MSVDAKRAERRTLQFDSLEAVLADAEALAAGPHRVSGNHSLAEILWHVAYFMDKPVTGFGFRAPLTMRMFGKVIRVMGMDRPVPAGIRPPREVEARFWPAGPVSPDEALAYLRRSVEAAKVPGAMRHPSPLLGRISHEQWKTVNLRHAELHLSFVHPEPAGAS